MVPVVGIHGWLPPFVGCDHVNAGEAQPKAPPANTGIEVDSAHCIHSGATRAYDQVENTQCSELVGTRKIQSGPEASSE